MAERVVLRVGKERYSLERGAVQAVLESPRISPLAGLSPRVAGVVSHRGQWIPALWLGRVLAELAGSTAWDGEDSDVGAVVVRRGGVTFALVADSAVVDSGEEEGEGLLMGETVIPLELEALFHAQLPSDLREVRLADAERSSAIQLSALSFRVADLEIGVPVGVVQEVLKPAAMERESLGRAEVVGRVEVRGEWVPVLDLRAWLGEAPAPDGEATRIIAAVVGDGLLGLRVDAVGQVVDARTESVVPTPPYLLPHVGSFLEAIVRVDDDRLLLLFRPDRLLAPEDLAAAAEAAGGS